ncbi:MAG: helix-turn-helix domain-containing protein [Chloroflexi bacterium]|nr:helix-turn-helix domain-containing protein [Chloroflexota bacterium]
MMDIDRLPEYTQYQDEGCDLHPSCLGCPLPLCRYDDPGGRRSGPRAFRDREIRRLRRLGHPIPALARRFGISTRTVHRILRRDGYE